MFQLGTLRLNLLFKWNFFLLTFLLSIALFVLVEDVSSRQHVSILTLVTLIGTDPVETVQILLDSFDEVATGDNCVRHGAKFLTWVLININVRHLLVLNGHIVTVLALFALFTHASLEVRTQGALVISYRSRKKHDKIRRANLISSQKYLLYPSSVVLISTTPLNRDISRAFCSAFFLFSSFSLYLASS